MKLLLSFGLLLYFGFIKGQTDVHYIKFGSGYDIYYGLVNNTHQKITDPKYDILQGTKDSKYYFYKRADSKGILNLKGEELFESENIEYYLGNGLAYNRNYELYNLELKQKIFSSDELTVGRVPFLLSSSGKFIVVEPLGIILDREGNQLNESPNPLLNHILKMEETGNNGLKIYTYQYNRDANLYESVVLNERGYVLSRETSESPRASLPMYTTSSNESVRKNNQKIQTKTAKGLDKSVLEKLLGQNKELIVSELVAAVDIKDYIKSEKSYFGIIIKDQNNKFGYANIEGEIIVPTIYDEIEIEVVNHATYAIIKNQKEQFTYYEGLYNIDLNEIILEPIYSHIKPLRNFDGFEVKSENKHIGYYINNQFFMPKECNCL